MFPMRRPAAAVDACDPHQNNPARLSPLLGRLFPRGVVGAELRSAVDPSQLFPDEVQSLGRASPRRLQEFAAGRVCARRALGQFGLANYPLRMASDRRPRWPATVVGSISHTTGMCGVVVAEREQFCGIGLDIEIVEQVNPEIWPILCTPEEMHWLATLRAPEQARYAALLFSAKEAFYKCQYNVTRQWLEFDDVTLDFSLSDLDAGCYAVRPRRKIKLLEQYAMPWTGRFEFYANYVVTAMVLAAS